MRRLLLALPFALPLALASPAALADAVTEPELTVGGYLALAEGERALYLAGLADALDYAAAGKASDNLRLVATCVHGFDRETLREAIDGAEPRLDWPDESSAAAWAVATMIQVCQLQMPPE